MTDQRLQSINAHMSFSPSGIMSFQDHLLTRARKAFECYELSPEDRTEAIKRFVTIAPHQEAEDLAIYQILYSMNCENVWCRTADFDLELVTAL